MTAITAGRLCPACDGVDLAAFGDKAGHALVRCRACGTLSTKIGSDGRVEDHDYDHYYDHATFDAPATVVHSLETLVESLASLRRTGRWLDVGYGEGALLSVAARHGWACYGVEVSPPALAYGQERGWIVSNAFDDSTFRPGQFDVVTMIELIEHVRAPRRFLAADARWLRPGGMLYATTPNADSLNRRCLGTNWSVVSPLEHVTIWTARGLRRALTAAGFEVIRARTEGCNPVELMAHLRPANVAGGDAINRNECGRALNAAMNRSRARRLLKSTINAQLNVLRLGDTLKVWARRAG